MAHLIVKNAKEVQTLRVAEEAEIMASIVMWKVFAKSNARRYALVFVLFLFSGRLLDFREQLGMNL